MSVAETKTEFTLEDLLALPDHKNFELVDGQLVEIDVSVLSNLIGTKIITRLDNYCEPRGLGPVFGADTYYECFPNHPRHARKPDVSFICKERLPANWLELRYFRIAPDLVVEVISPNDSSYEVEAKIVEYLDAGVQLVWVVHPERRWVYVHRADGTVTRLRENDTLSGEAVIAGFACRVGDLFPAPATV